MYDLTLVSSLVNCVNVRQIANCQKEWNLRNSADPKSDILEN
jgi:hypothetical protein